MLTEFPFTLPVSNKELRWKPIEVGRELDVTASHSSANMRHMLGTALLMARIVFYDGKDQAPTLAQVRGWDSFDLEAFGEEVESKESMRKAVFRKERMGQDPAAMLKKSIEDAQVAVSAVGVALKAVLEAHEIAEQAAAPLA